MARSRASSVIWAVFAGLIVGAGAGAGCGVSDPGDPTTRCSEAADCTANGPCELATGATCDENGLCHYLPKQCNTPPAPTCAGENVYRAFASTGTCQGDGSCTYAPYDSACPNCATNCAGSCDGVVCNDVQGGCRAAGRCVPGGTCFYEKAPEQSACDDSNLCTYGERCSADGHCVGTTVSCVNDPGTCGARRSCNGTSTCTTSYPGTNTACDDGNASTYGDRCNGGGQCVGTPITCTSSSSTCGLKRTPNGTSSCTEYYPGPSTPCNDGNLCTHTDHCNGAGACTGTSITCSNSSGACPVNRSCNGTSSCTTTYPNNDTMCGNSGNCYVCRSGSCVTGCPSGERCASYSGSYYCE